MSFLSLFILHYKKLKFTLSLKTSAMVIVKNDSNTSLGVISAQNFPVFDSIHRHVE